MSWREAVTAVLRAYAQVVFSHRPLVGAILLAATLVVPQVGLTGLAGVALSTAWGAALRLDRSALAGGALGYNALLVFLGVGATLQQSPAFWVLAVVVALVTVLVHVALTAALGHLLRLPAMSLPFVVTLWIATAAAPHIRGMGMGGHPPALDLGAFPGPAAVDDLLRAAGALFFQPHWTAGALVMLALVVHSRIATVHALLGFAVMAAADAWLFTFPPGFSESYLGFNLMMAAVALGGVYHVPSPGSLAVAAVGTLATALVGVAALTWLTPFGLPVLALPFNLTVLLVLYALGARGGAVWPQPVDVVGRTPEEALEHHRTRTARLAFPLPVRLILPFRGTWVCTQGHDGAHTHQGAWRHGLDFELADADGRTFHGAGDRLTDFLCYGAPVLAPALGTVVSVVDGHPDVPPGTADLAHPWGNAVVIAVAPDLYVVLAHLQPGSAAVRPGQVVHPGQEIARCGASGRAPRPHLHVQLQRTPELGAPTVPIAFADAVAADGGETWLSAALIPAEGHRVRNVQVDPGLAAALTLPLGGRLRFDVDGAIDEVLATTDLHGVRQLVCPARGAVLVFDNLGSSFLVHDYAGPRAGALWALSLALSKVPFDDAPALTWTDAVNRRRVSPSVGALLRDAVAWLLPPPMASIAFRAERTEAAITVAGAASALGVSTTATFDRTFGRLVGVDVVTPDGRVTVRVVEPAAAREAA